MIERAHERYYLKPQNLYALRRFREPCPKSDSEPASGSLKHASAQAVFLPATKSLLNPRRQLSDQ